jgi:hypothetical protein
VTTTIDKSAESLHNYFETVGKENEGVLDYLQSGMTGALNHLDNAWGDFIRAIGESGLGDLIVKIVRDIATAMDGITAWINKNSPYIKGFFQGLIEGWDAVYQGVKSALDTAYDYISDFFDDSEKESKTGLSNIGLFLSNFFEFARAGFMEYVAKPAANAWTALKGGFKGASEWLAELAYTGDFDKAADAYNDVINETSDEMLENTRIMNRAIDLQFDEIEKKTQRIKDELKKNPVQAPTVPTFKALSLGGSSGGSKGARAEADNWAKYYDKVKDLAKNGLSDLRKLEARHTEQLAELDEEFKKSRLATESEYLNAKKIINDEYMRQYKDIQKQAQDFLKEIYDDDVVNLQDTYRAKLELLDQYHDESLVSEEDYLKAREKLYTDYTAELNKIEKKSKGSVLSEDDVENLEHFHDAMDSMSDAFSNLTQGLNESSASYKALFTIQKSFAVASATVKAALAWMTALSESKTWYEALANYAAAISLTTSIISQLKSVSMHDKGGYIKGGQLGIVGEYGPEIVRGPASVTSRKDTAAMARASMGGSSVTVNLYEDRAKAGQVEQSSTQDGEQIINIFVSNIRKGGQIAQTMESTYALRRYGA